MLHDRRRITTRTLGAVAVVMVVAALTVACRPEPVPETTATPTVTVKPPGPTPTPIETELPGAQFDVPTDCEQIYSSGMLADLEADNPPLNDPGVTMYSTQDVDLIQIIDNGAPTLRCSWGQPGEYGLATNVTAVDAEQAAFIEQELSGSGFACEPFGDGTVCRFEQKGITLDDEEYTGGETHYIGGGGWVSTAWINFAPKGYTEDIVDTLWD